jgi:hypothetical protein
MHGDEAGDKWQVVEYFPCLSPTMAIGDISILVAIWAYGTILVFPSKAAARVNAAVVSDWLKPRKSLQSRSADFDCRDVLLGEGKWNFGKCVIRQM